MSAAPVLAIEAVDPQHPQALRLLAEAAVEARALYPELFHADSPAPINSALREREVYLLAWRDGAALGCGALRCHDIFTGELRRMFVSQRARRDGVARALLEQLEAQARAFSYRQLILETGVKQQPAIALYRSAGWRRIAAFGSHVGDPTALCLGKSLSRKE